MGAEWPLVGRAELLRDVVAAAAGGVRSGVVVVGPAGVGRTRLARAALDAVCAHRPRCLPWWVQAGGATSSVPLGALAPVLGDLGSATAGGPGWTTVRLLGAARDRLLQRSGGARPVIAVDDAHLLDDVSAVLLQRLAATGEAFVLATVPSGARVPAPVFAMWKEGAADRADLHPLDRAQCDRLVGHALGADRPGTLVDDGALSRLWLLSGGTPLLLRELVDGAVGSGTLHRVGTVWRWDGPFPRTPRLADLIEAQLGERSDAERDLVGLLAFGQPCDGEVAVALVGRDAVDAAERRGPVVSTRHGDRVDLHVPLLHAELVRAAATPWQEREIYRRLSEATQAVQAARAAQGPGDGGPDARTRRQLLLWGAARGVPAAPSALLDAALRTGTGAGTRESVRLLVAAAARPAGPEVRAGIASALIRFGEFERADALLAELADRTDPTGPPDAAQAAQAAEPSPVRPGAADVALVRVHHLYWGLRAMDRIGPVLDDADRAATAAGRPPDAVLRAFRALLGGRAAEAAATLAPVVAEPGARLGALAVAAVAAARLGRYATAVELAVRADVLPTGGGPPPDDGAGGWLRLELLTAWWFALLQTGDLDGADRLAEPCLRDARERGVERHAAVFTTWLGITEARRGRSVTAANRLLQAAAAVPAARFCCALPLAGELAAALAAAGHPPEARQVLAEGERAPWGVLLGGWARPAGVLLAGIDGRTAPAAELALAAADSGDAHGHRMQALHTAVRLGVTGAVTDRLVALAADAQGPLERSYGEHAAALATRDGDGLDRVAARFAGLGMFLLAAEAAAQAARTHHDAGEPGRAAASAGRARTWAAGCQDARTPALASLRGSAELTPREQEIAALAATGMTSKAIAAELVISVRTVDNVLRSVYAKLGVSRRGDLVRVAGLRPTS